MRNGGRNATLLLEIGGLEVKMRKPSGPDGNELIL